MRELMRRLATYVMGGYLPAIGMVAFASLIALLLPPLTMMFAYVSGAALALVTLRKGWQNGLVVMTGAVALVALLTGLLFGNALPLAIANLVYWLPVWLVALVLRATVRLDQALHAALMLGLTIVVAVYAAIGDPAAWWQSHLSELFQMISEQGGADFTDQAVILAPWMTGLAIAGLVVGILIALLLGRWWQAILYNPGGFGGEFRQLRLGQQTVLLAGILIAMSFGLPGLGGSMAGDGLIIVTVGLLMQGLAVVHAMAHQRKRHVGWLVGLYILLLLATFQVAPLIALLGAADNWFRFRERAAS